MIHNLAFIFIYFEFYPLYYYLDSIGEGCVATIRWLLGHKARDPNSYLFRRRDQNKNTQTNKTIKYSTTYAAPPGGRMMGDRDTPQL